MKLLSVKKVHCIGKEATEIKKIYTDAFLKSERMPYWLMIAMANLWHTDLLAFYDGSKPIGMIYLGKTRKLIFIMFFAVDQELRSNGYGSKILKKISEMYPNKKIIISIERCDVDSDDLEIRKRRRNFYLRNGYQPTGYMVRLAGIEQEIIIANGEFDKKEFRNFFIMYSNGTMYPKIWEQEMQVL